MWVWLCELFGLFGLCDGLINPQPAQNSARRWQFLTIVFVPNEWKFLLFGCDSQGGSVNVYSPSNPDMDAQDTTPMDKAELLLLRCVQPYVKELVKKRLLFSVTRVEDIGVAVERPPSELPALVPRHCATSWCLVRGTFQETLQCCSCEKLQRKSKWQSTIHDVDMCLNMCPVYSAKYVSCLQCQYVDRMVIRRKPRKWFRKIFSEEL